MTLKNYSTRRLESELLAIVAKYLDVRLYRVFFFGSRVSGRGSDRSDVDVGIQGPEPIPHAIMARIKNDIEELPTLYTVDIVDFRSLSDDFQTVALEHTEPFHTVHA